MRDRVAGVEHEADVALRLNRLNAGVTARQVQDDLGELGAGSLDYLGVVSEVARDAVPCVVKCFEEHLQSIGSCRLDDQLAGSHGSSCLLMRSAQVRNGVDDLHPAGRLADDRSMIPLSRSEVVASVEEKEDPTLR